MSISARSKRFVSPPSFFYRLQTLILFSQKSNHPFAGNAEKARFHHQAGPETSCLDTTTWKTVDARSMGIYGSMVSPASWLVLKILQSKGFEAYLVGGCVRDLILRRIPKDFDVITTAQLKQIKKQFNRSYIVGTRFPICLVHVKGSVIEVSSFDTVAKHDEEKKKIPFSQMPSGCSKKDFILWKNCLSRDFTINSLFYDPFLNKIYDYTNGMRDLSLCKMRTVIPAQFSFREDCARILRGLRIAARLGLSFSKETSTAIRNLSSSVKALDKSRLMMEMNYMLSYGAAETSFCLLRRFELLEFLFPFHAAYLAHEAPNQSVQSSLMLMKLFSSADKLLACDRPSDCSLWVALLSFHMALVNNPQDALVILAFSSVLYHGNWREAVNFARKAAQLKIHFVPEVLESCGTMSDEALAEEVSHLSSLVVSSIDALTNPDSSFSMEFVSKKVGQNVAALFDVLLGDIEVYINQRESFKINYDLLGKGNRNETRFVLGKVIMDAMSSGVIIERQHQQVIEEENCLTQSNIQQHAAVEKENCCSPHSISEQSGEVVVMDKLCKPVFDLGIHHHEVVKKGKHHQSQSNLVEPCQKDERHQSIFNQNKEKVMIKEKLCQPDSDIGKHQQTIKKRNNHHHQPSSDQEQLEDVVNEENIGKNVRAVKKGKHQQAIKKRNNHHQPSSDQEQLEDVVNEENLGKNVRAVKKGKHQQTIKKRNNHHQPSSDQEQLEDVVNEENIGKKVRAVKKGKHQQSSTLEQKQEPNNKDKCQHSVVSNQEKEQEVDKEKVICRKPLSSLFSKDNFQQSVVSKQEKEQKVDKDKVKCRKPLSSLFSVN